MLTHRTYARLKFSQKKKKKKVINYGTRILFLHVNAFAKCQ